MEAVGSRNEPSPTTKVKSKAKDASAWLRDYITAIKNGRWHPFTPPERLTRAATRNEPWGPTGEQLRALAREVGESAASQSVVLAVLEVRLLQSDVEKWRNVYKALLVIDFVLRRCDDGVEGGVVGNRGLVAAVARLAPAARGGERSAGAGTVGRGGLGGGGDGNGGGPETATPLGGAFAPAGAPPASRVPTTGEAPPLTWNPSLEASAAASIRARAAAVLEILEGGEALRAARIQSEAARRRDRETAGGPGDAGGFGGVPDGGRSWGWPGGADGASAGVADGGLDGPAAGGGETRGPPATTSYSSGSSKGVTPAEAAKHAALVGELAREPGVGLECGDCGPAARRRMLGLPAGGPAARRPAQPVDWASTTAGVFLCLECAGVHRGLGVHISAVRSLTLDAWTASQVAALARAGNTRANDRWLARLGEARGAVDFLPPPHAPLPPARRAELIRRKYAAAEWSEGSWPPDPKTGAASEGAQRVLDALGDLPSAEEGPPAGVAADGRARVVGAAASRTPSLARFAPTPAGPTPDYWASLAARAGSGTASQPTDPQAPPSSGSSDDRDAAARAGDEPTVLALPAPPPGTGGRLALPAPPPRGSGLLALPAPPRRDSGLLVLAAIEEPSAPRALAREPTDLLSGEPMGLLEVEAAPPLTSQAHPPLYDLAGMARPVALLTSAAPPPGRTPAKPPAAPSTALTAAEVAASFSADFWPSTAAPYPDASAGGASALTGPSAGGEPAAAAAALAPPGPTPPDPAPREAPCPAGAAQPPHLVPQRRSAPRARGIRSPYPPPPKAPSARHEQALLQMFESGLNDFVAGSARRAAAGPAPKLPFATAAAGPTALPGRPLRERC